jgi:hypothetical protein
MWTSAHSRQPIERGEQQDLPGGVAAERTLKELQRFQEGRGSALVFHEHYSRPAQLCHGQRRDQGFDGTGQSSQIFTRRTSPKRFKGFVQSRKPRQMAEEFGDCGEKH